MHRGRKAGGWKSCFAGKEEEGKKEEATVGTRKDMDSWMKLPETFSHGTCSVKDIFCL